DVLRDRLADAQQFGEQVAGELADGLRADVRSLADLTDASHLASIARDLEAWELAQGHCTDAATPVPPPASPRILIAVGGSSAAPTGTRAAQPPCGPPPPDATESASAGGRPPPAVGDRSALAGLPASTYSSADTEQDLTASAQRLDELLAEVAAAQPGVPIDV